MFKRLTNHFEDPERPLLGPNVKLLKYGGLLFSKNKKIKYFFLSVHCIGFIFSAFAMLDIWFERSNLDIVLRNLKYTMLIVVDCSKDFTYLKWQDDWLYIINFITKIDKERRNKKQTEIKNIINKYTKYSRLVTFSYLYLLTLTGILVCVQPMFLYISPTFRFNVRNGTERRPEIVNCWMPFDKTTLEGHIFSMCFQGFVSYLAAMWIVMFDTTAIAIMIFVEAELRMLRIDARNIFGSEKKPATLAESKERIENCHKSHSDLIQICSAFNDFMSPIMFLYTVVCSVMLCGTAYQIQVETSVFQKIMPAQYLLFGILQLFMYCWHSSVMLHSSIDLAMGPYESTWWTRPVALQKEMLLLVHQFRKPLLVHAGPFADLTVLTFISILKGAYSYNTLLRASLK